MTLGETLIVTNGTENWIQDSAARFVPGLLPTLKKVTTISARARHESSYPEDPYAWKREAFSELLACYPGQRGFDSTPSTRSECSNPDGPNILVIGDSWYEIEAARSTFGLPGAVSAVKTLKFKEAPTVQELLGQLRRCTQELARLAVAEQSASWGLAPKTLPSHLECLVACASAWSVASESAGGFVFSRPPSPVMLPSSSPTPPPEPEKSLPAAYSDAGFARPPGHATVEVDDSTAEDSADNLPGTMPSPECQVAGTYHVSGVDRQAWVF
eukprot:CAMPEP_0176330640 /NCGR_PEP_ID=MMETSP0121_2-20121125/76131_1 /TAXON_ID=160619 /ORGANISM="Kryptoperidinium foliaceum, Strain CCMP 1326" /LENGTH=270 /DNA_ID=CAMNT_0017673445 /DNA_START=194 /DNA_END=1006 /DNA_ORIENTATION=+